MFVASIDSDLTEDKCIAKNGTKGIGLEAGNNIFN